MNIEKEKEKSKGKSLSHLFQMEERVIRPLKSLEDQGEISEKRKNNLYPSGSKTEVLHGPAKSIRH